MNETIRPQVEEISGTPMSKEKPHFLEILAERLRNLRRREAEIPTIHEIEALTLNEQGSPNLTSEEAKELIKIHNDLQGTFQEIENIDTNLGGQPIPVESPMYQEVPRVGKEWHPGEQIELEHLALVRCDEYLPVEDEQGNFALLTAGTVTEGRTPRLTKHFTLNHPVEPVNEGFGGGSNWEYSNVVYIIPAPVMIEVNGRPENFLEVDAFWAKDVVIPKGTVIITTKEVNPELLKRLQEKGIIMVKYPESQKPWEIARIQLKAMGYTPFKGGNWETRDPAAREAMREFQKKEGYSSGIHAGSAFSAFEKGLIILDSYAEELGIHHNQFEHLIQIDRDRDFYDGMLFGVNNALAAIRNQKFPQMKRWATQRLTTFVSKTLPEYPKLPSYRDSRVSEKFERSLEYLFRWLATDHEALSQIDEQYRDNLLDLLGHSWGFGYGLTRAIFLNREKFTTEWQQKIEEIIHQKNLDPENYR